MELREFTSSLVRITYIHDLLRNNNKGFFKLHVLEIQDKIARSNASLKCLSLGTNLNLFVYKLG